MGLVNGDIDRGGVLVLTFRLGSALDLRPVGAAGLSREAEVDVEVSSFV